MWRPLATNDNRNDRYIDFSMTVYKNADFCRDSAAGLSGLNFGTSGSSRFKSSSEIIKYKGQI